LALSDLKVLRKAGIYEDKTKCDSRIAGLCIAAGLAKRKPEYIILETT